MKQKRLQYKIAVWLTMGLMVMDPLVVPLAYAENPIEVDRNGPHGYGSFSSSFSLCRKYYRGRS